MMLTPQTDLAVAQALMALKAERDRAVKYAEAAPHPGSAPWKEMQAVYAERDRLRDLVRRLADNLANYHIVGERERALLREARAAIGEDKP